MKMIQWIAMLLIVCGLTMAQTVTTTGSGNWSSTTADAPWPLGNPPSSTDNVVIADGHTVTLDQNATIKNLTIGGGTSGTLQTTTTAGAYTLTVDGNVVVNSGATLTAKATTDASGSRVFTMNISGDYTFNGTLMKMRDGSATATPKTITGFNLVFNGSGNSTITGSGFTITGNNFNSIKIDKTGAGKLILGTTIYMSGGSTSDTPTQSVLKLTNGIIETGANALIHLSSSVANVEGGTSSSYVNGTLGRAMGSSGATKTFQIGDANGYRPIIVKSTTGSPSTSASGYHWVSAKVVVGDANADNVSMTGGIVKVSSVRYYEVAYNQGSTSTTSMSFSQWSPSYGADDGVVGSNTDLRVAYSTDNRVTWNGMTQTTPHTTDLSSPPVSITPDALGSPISTNNGVVTMVSIATTSTSSNPLPVELASFTASSKHGMVELNWQTVTETNNAGFDVQKKVSDEWTSLGFVAGAGTSNAPKSYSFVDRNVETGVTSYRLKQTDRDGKVSYSNTVEVNAVGAPTALALNGNYPNPFNPATTISFSVPTEGTAVVKVFDLLGKEVATVYAGTALSGKRYAVPFNASALPSGIYFSQLEFGGQRLVKKMLLMK